MIPNLSKEMIDLMQQLRKRLRSEFGVELKLSQEDIVQRILSLVEKSKDQKTLLLFADLEDMMGISLPRSQQDEGVASIQAAEPEKVAKRIYRGHAILEEPKVAHSKTQRMYRGQVVA